MQYRPKNTAAPQPVQKERRYGANEHQNDSWNTIESKAHFKRCENVSFFGPMF